MPRSARRAAFLVLSLILLLSNSAQGQEGGTSFPTLRADTDGVTHFADGGLDWSQAEQRTEGFEDLSL